MNWRRISSILVTHLLVTAVVIFCLAIAAFFGIIIGIGYLFFEERQHLIPLYYTETPLLCRIYLTVFMIYPLGYNFTVMTFRMLVPLTNFLIVHLPLMFLIEVVTDEYCAYTHSNDESASIGEIEDGNWELVAALRSSNNGFDSDQFCPAVICDSDQRDDPFWPQHVSVVHVIEIRRRSAIWKEIVVWRVSILSGDQTKLCVLHSPLEIDKPFSRRFDMGSVKSFQSGGVVFVAFPNLDGLELVVYDTRTKEKSEYYWFFSRVLSIQWRWMQSAKLISMTYMGKPGPVETTHDLAGLIGRAMGTDNGWRIRVLHAEIPHTVNGQLRVNLVNSIVDLRRGAKVIRRTTISMVGFQGFVRLKAIRTSEGLFGVCAEDSLSDDDPVMLYDRSAELYVYFQNREELMNYDRPFSRYVEETAPPEVERTDDLCPTVLNNRECIEAFRNGEIYRTPYVPPSMLFASAKKIFRVAPDLRNRMNAEQFRQMTGIRGMEPHLG